MVEEYIFPQTTQLVSLNKMKNPIQMVDLKGQYSKIKKEIDLGIQKTINNAQFIGGENVELFKKSLESYLNVKHVIPCANGTDALQIAIMALDLKRGEEVLIPAFTYVATAEVIGLLGLKPIMLDVDFSTFNIDLNKIESLISKKTRAIVPVHLFGQAAPMKEILEIAKKYDLYVIEDNAQAIGAEYFYDSNSKNKLGTLGDIGCISFFPSKNLGCYGDGGAMMTNSDELAQKVKMIANHGQSKKYHHKVIGCNSRLDSIQASILNTKLKYLDQYNMLRARAANYYDKSFKLIEEIEIPHRVKYSTHVFHQYTLKIKNGKRDKLKSFLGDKGIPSMVYYPIPLYKQEAFRDYVENDYSLPVTEKLCEQVLSLPIHTELTVEIQNYIIENVNKFFSL